MIFSPIPLVKGMWIYIFIGIFLIYALYKERQALGCGSMLDGRDCDNANGKAVKGTAPLSTDPPGVLLNKIDYAAAYQNRFVKWRAVFIVSFCTAMLLWFVVYKRIPSEWELVVVMTVLFVTMFMATSFYRFHLYDHINENIDASTNLLRQHVAKDDEQTSPVP